MLLLNFSHYIIFLTSFLIGSINVTIFWLANQQILLISVVLHNSIILRLRLVSTYTVDKPVYCKRTQTCSRAHDARYRVNLLIACYKTWRYPSPGLHNKTCKFSTHYFVSTQSLSITVY